MKKRIGKINKNIEELNSLEKTPYDLLDLFLQEKEAFNASAETVKQYRYLYGQIMRLVACVDHNIIKCIENTISGTIRCADLLSKFFYG